VNERQIFQKIFTDLDLSVFEGSSTAFTNYNSVVTYYKNKLRDMLPSYYDDIKLSGSNIEELLNVYAKLLAYTWVVTYGSTFSLTNVPAAYVYKDFSLLLDFDSHFPESWNFKQIYAFLTALLYVYLHGSTKPNIQYAMEILLEKKPDIWELSKLIGHSALYDISYIHTFNVFIYAADSPYFWGSYILASKLLRKIKPAHTLFETAIVFTEEWGYNLNSCYNFGDPYTCVCDTGEWTCDTTHVDIPSILDCAFTYVTMEFCEELSPCSCGLSYYDAPCTGSTDCCPSWRSHCCSPEWALTDEVMPDIIVTDIYSVFDPCGPFVYDPAPICVPPFDTAIHCGRPFDYLVSCYDSCMTYDVYSCAVEFVEGHI